MSRATSWVLAPVAGLLALGCQGDPTGPAAPPTARPSAAVVTNERTSFIDLDAFSQCTGAIFPTTGTAHEVVSMTETGGGVFKVVAHLQIHATGTDPVSGAPLVIKMVQTDVFPDVSFPQEGTTEISSKIIAKGSAPNEVNHLRYHLTLNANGTITASFDELITRCQ